MFGILELSIVPDNRLSQSDNPDSVVYLTFVNKSEALTIEVTMPFEVEDQFEDVIQESYRLSGTTIFLDDEVLPNADMLRRVGTEVALLKSNI